MSDKENADIRVKLKQVPRTESLKRTGFSIWTGDAQSKQVINAIYNSGNYTEKFEQDIVEAEKSIVISSPDIRQEV